mmetsp:Transcript_14571/g.37082  ORF Transcript_14571/g.37082 Transcript_14571/m.37082 type:complete len:318 (+) Transcript_14571:1745-2698(+)
MSGRGAGGLRRYSCSALAFDVGDQCDQRPHRCGRLGVDRGWLLSEDGAAGACCHRRPRFHGECCWRLRHDWPHVADVPPRGRPALLQLPLRAASWHPPRALCLWRHALDADGIPRLVAVVHQVHRRIVVAEDRAHWECAWHHGCCWWTCWHDLLHACAAGHFGADAGHNGPWQWLGCWCRFARRGHRFAPACCGLPQPCGCGRCVHSHRLRPRRAWLWGAVRRVDIPRRRHRRPYGHRQLAGLRQVAGLDVRQAHELPRPEALLGTPLHCSQCRLGQLHPCSWEHGASRCYWRLRGSWLDHGGPGRRCRHACRHHAA